jgi:hypothetical protein
MNFYNLCVVPVPIQSSQLKSLDELWKERYLEKFKTYILPSENQHWGQLILRWHEKRGDEIISHVYAPWIDTTSWNGIYIDDRPKKIYAKIFFQCLCRPIHLIVKSVHHLLMIPVFYEISKTLSNKQTFKECLIHSIRSIVDIIRTPLFDLVNIVISIAILLFSSFNSDLIFTGRRMLGEIEKISNWGVKNTPWTLTSCFQPYEFSFLFTYENKNHDEDTLYPSDDPLDRQLTNFARSAVHFNQTHIDLTSCQKASFDLPYISSIDLIIEE